MNDKKFNELNSEYAFLQWHKIWLREEIKKADKEQDKIKKELSE